MSQVHEHLIQLRWSDPDSYGHINHARALSLLEDARLAMAAEAPGVVPGRQPDIILARLEVDYLRQLYYRVGERLLVRSWVLRMGSKSLTVRQELVQDDQTAIRLDAVLVLFDMTADASRAMTEQERAHWGRYLPGESRADLQGAALDAASASSSSPRSTPVGT